MGITILSGFGSVKNRQCSDLLSNDLSIKSTRRPFEIWSYASDEMHTTASASYRKVLKDFKTGGFKGSRARSHFPYLGELASGRGVKSLFIK